MNADEIARAGKEQRWSKPSCRRDDDGGRPDRDPASPACRAGQGA